MDKAAQYLQLVRQRKACARCVGMGMKNAAEIADGRFDSDEIGPLSQWQGNLDAELMIVLQDFADVDGFLEYLGWPGEAVQTNLNLAAYLTDEVGIPIGAPRRGVSDDKLFFTNAVLCMKEHGGMGAKLGRSCARECGQRFLVPIIQVVSPKLVVTLGEHAFRSVWRAFKQERAPKLPTVVAQQISLTGRTRMMPLYHTSPRTRGTRPIEQQRADWRKVRDALNAAA